MSLRSVNSWNAASMAETCVSVEVISDSGVKPGGGKEVLGSTMRKFFFCS